MKKQLLLLMLAAVTAVSAWALPARRGFVAATDTEGNPIRVERVGNAFNHRTLTADGVEVFRQDDGTYAPVTEAQKVARRAARARRVPGQIGTFPGTTFPAKGKQKAIVVLVEFKDQKFELGDHAHDYFYDMLNKDDFSEYGATGGVHKYFMDSSDGQFDCQFDLFGPVTLSKNLAYYGSNDRNDHDQHADEMVVEACKALDATVDFSQYDRDNDGVIDNVYVIYAGRGEASDITGEHTELIWPHSWDVSSRKLKFDGKLLATYGCSNEWEDVYAYDRFGNLTVTGENPDGIGTFVHEFSHILGLPDLYDTVSDDNLSTPGEWSVLDYGPYNNNGRTPPAYSAFERNALGWITLTELTAESGDVIIPELNSSNSAYAITNPLNSSEFFLLESRVREGWDKYIPGDGMLIWHVDYNSDRWQQNTVNNNQSHQYVDLIEADGVASKNNGRTASDAFPGSKMVTSFRPRWWTDGYAGIDLTAIALADDNAVSLNAAPVADNPGVDPGNGDWKTVKQIAYSTPTYEDVTVRGYIVGYVTSGNYTTGCVFSADGAVNTNILLADDPLETDPDNCIPLQLPKGSERNALNLSDNSANLGRHVEITGTHSLYFGVNGIRDIKAHTFISDEENAITDIQASSLTGAAIYDLQGRRVTNPRHGALYIVNGRKLILR